MCQRNNLFIYLYKFLYTIIACSILLYIHKNLLYCSILLWVLWIWILISEPKVISKTEKVYRICVLNYKFCDWSECQTSVFVFVMSIIREYFSNRENSFKVPHLSFWSTFKIRETELPRNQRIIRKKIYTYKEIFHTRRFFIL